MANSTEGKPKFLQRLAEF